MPKSPARSDSKVQEDEARILQAVQQRPEIMNTLNQITRSHKKQQSTWDDLAAEFDSTTEVLKRVWLKARQSTEPKKEAVRPRSARSSLAEPTRRSLRCQSIDKTISIASTTVPESTDNSCATSSCGGSPARSAGSRRNLEAINETSDDLRAVAEPKQEHEEEEKPVEKEDEKPDEVVQPQPTSAKEENGEQTAFVTASTSSNLARYLESTLPAESKQSRPQRFSEPAPTPRTAHGVNNPQRRTNLCNKALIRPKGQPVNPEDPTWVFFESMGLTVMSFPQHLQASIKVQVSNIVHEMEYDLSLPGNTQVDKSVAVMVGS
ncbi:uncharacterized protein LOC100123663 isoform X2 [Nasonia vitripennis]|uniref:MADF domain-containing protein n=1 Tax=Nasonia vitripennis TaxID=7425 RepID=A0A7M7GD72_NASVI|nr:uncharacterized protein LOC100123663 isoform X2 [Nasonia vitripennis]